MKHLICFVLFSLLFHVCAGQNIETLPADVIEMIDSAAVEQVGDRIMETTVSIYNPSNSKLSFILGESLANLDTFKLKENEVWYSPAYNVDPILKIQTKKIIKTYQLRLGESYMIYWNDNKKYWDLTTLRK